MVALKPRTDGDAPLLGRTADEFGLLVEPLRRELLVHCYRMLGSVHDAEDAVQDALANAWNRRQTFQRAVSLRAWLYRIATNACLDAIERRKRGAARDERLAVGPFPDALLAESAAGPESRFDARESISLAFLTALQVLPPRQRAVLILRDVLSWRASEVATLLEVSVPAVNSALQRARSTVGGRYPKPAERQPNPPSQLRNLLDRYVRAWESADIAGLVALLREDSLLRMPPMPTVIGARAIGAFFASSVFTPGRRIRLIETRANGKAAFVAYSGTDGETLRPFTLLALSTAAGHVAAIDAWSDPATVARFAAIDDLRD